MGKRFLTILCCLFLAIKVTKITHEKKVSHEEEETTLLRQLFGGFKAHQVKGEKRICQEKLT
jgi:hypothetical protein